MAAITCIVKISNILRISSSIGAIYTDPAWSRTTIRQESLAELAQAVFRLQLPPLRREPVYRHLEDVAGLLEEYSFVALMNFMSHSLQIC